MNRTIGIAIAMLVTWAIGTVLEWPGWIHGLLTVGVFLLIYGVVTRGKEKGLKGS